MLTEQKFDKLSEENIELKEYYVKQDNGYFKCRLLNQNEHDRLKNIFDNLSFNALNFTDSRSVFQFYPLYRLWNDIQCFVNTLGDRLKAVVLRDNDGHHDASLLPFTCAYRESLVTDWRGLIRGLRDINFQGRVDC